MMAAKATGIGATAAVLYACTFSKPSPLGAVPEDSNNKSHHLKGGRGFFNPWNSWKERSTFEVARIMLWQKLTGRFPWPNSTPPVRKPTFLQSRTGSQALRATWLGHACYYVEFPSGLRVLFDPVFEDRCAPFKWFGPKRYTEKPVDIEGIPNIDVVIISHSHYDHLSHPTILKIKKHNPNALFAAPLGLKKWFNHSGIENVVELDWWQDIDLTLVPITDEDRTTTATSLPSNIAASPSSRAEIKARISCLPCQHTSARSPFDRNETLWASWAVSSGDKSVWFGGDTGYRAVPNLPKNTDDYGQSYAELPRCPVFKQIGNLRGPFDLGLIPIGAYYPRSVMSSMHSNPFDSVEIFTDTKCKRAMGIHWGTWVLTTEEVMEPPVLLRTALKKKGLPEQGVFDICDIGESKEF